MSSTLLSALPVSMPVKTREVYLPEPIATDGLYAFTAEMLPNSETEWAQQFFRAFPDRPARERLLILEGQSQYGALNHFSACLTRALEHRGHEARCINVYQNAQSSQQLAEALKHFQPTALLSFNGVHESITLQNNRSIGQHLGIPSISWFVDHHFVQFPRIVHQDYKEKINAYAIIDAMHSTLHRSLPTGLEAMNVPLRIGGYPNFDRMQPYAGRSAQILVPSSYAPLREKQAKLRFPRFPQLEALCHAAMDYLIASPEHRADAFLLDGLEKMGIPLTDISAAHFMELYVNIHHGAEMYWRETLLKAARNIPLTLCGNGWHKADFISDKWTVFTPQEGAGLMQWPCETQMVWNIFPMFPTTGHDRIFNATANGALLLTEHKDWLAHEYGDSLAWVPQQPEAVEDCLQHVLNTPVEARATQARAAQAITLNRHTFLNSVLGIEQVLEQYALRNALSQPVSLLANV
jgi:hypothetical protein